MTAHDEIPGLSRRRPPESRMDRLPPHTAEGEQGVLGCILLEPDLIQTVRERLVVGPDAFFELRHRSLYEVLLAMADARRGIDFITLVHALKDAGQLEAIGGLPYLGELQGAVPSTAHLTYYLDMLVDMAQRRSVLKVGAELVARAYEGVQTGAELVAEATQAVGKLTDSAPRVVELEWNTVVREVVGEIEEASRGRKQMRGLPSGLNFLDNMTCGWKPEEFVLVVGRPGGGKTSLGMQFVEHLVVDHRMPVGVFSQEMSYKVLAQRMLFSVSGVDFQKFRNGFFRDVDLKHIVTGCSKVKDAPIRIDDTPGIHCEDLEIRARRWVRDHGVKMIVIDYLGLIAGRRGERYSGENNNQREAHASAAIMRMKKELKIPIIVLAQENTNREKADRDRKPLLSDVKGSQQSVQDADVVMFLTDVNLDRAKRDLRSNDDTKREIAEAQFRWRTSKSVLALPQYIRDDEEANLKRVNLYVAKQRNGPTGDCALVFVKPWMRFIDAFVEGSETVAQSSGGHATQDEFEA